VGRQQRISLRVIEVEDVVISNKVKGKKESISPFYFTERADSLAERVFGNGSIDDFLIVIYMKKS